MTVQVAGTEAEQAVEGEAAAEAATEECLHALAPGEHARPHADRLDPHAAGRSADERRALGLGLLRVISHERMAAEFAPHLERGRPTALAVHADTLCVGSTLGHVLVFSVRNGSHRGTLWLHGGGGGGSGRSASGVSGGGAYAASTGPGAPPAARASPFSSSLSSTLSSSLAASLGGRRGVAPPPAASPAVDAVTAVRINDGGGLVLVGHASGALVLWDLHAHALLKACPSLHDAPVCHIRFLHPTRPHVLTADKGGAWHVVQRDTPCSVWHAAIRHATPRDAHAAAQSASRALGTRA